MSGTKLIPQTKYNQAKALFIIAAVRYAEGRKLEDELCKLLGYSDGYAGHISDRLWDMNGDFDEALMLEGMKLKRGKK